jgi:uncharacterized membrane protein
MTMDFTLVTLVADLATLFLLFLSLVFTAGIVWRVERELDVSYKFFLVALVVLLLAESLGKFFSETQVYAMISSMLKVVFGLLLLAGVWTMRDIVRKLDGEKFSQKVVK